MKPDFVKGVQASAITRVRQQCVRGLKGKVARNHLQRSEFNQYLR